MNEDLTNEYRDAVVEAALRDVAQQLAEAGLRFCAGELTVEEYLQLVREADDMASSIRGLV